jgi:hypothetical protein
VLGHVLDRNRSRVDRPPRVFNRQAHYRNRFHKSSARGYSQADASALSRDERAAPSDSLFVLQKRSSSYLLESYLLAS